MTIELGATVLRAGAGFESAVDDLFRAVDERMPLLFGKAAARTRIESGMTSAIDDALRSLDELHGADVALHDTVAGARQALETADPRHHAGLVEARGRLHHSGLPGTLRDAASEFRRFGTSQRVQALARELADDPATTRASATAQFRALSATMRRDWVEPELERLAVLSALPERVRPAAFAARLPHPETSIVDGIGLGWHPARHDILKANVDAVHILDDQLQLAADPSLTANDHAAELLDLLARSQDELDPAAFYRMSVLAGLPDGLRPPVPAPLDAARPFRDIGLAGYRPTGHYNWLQELSHVRAGLAEGVDEDVLVRVVRDRLHRGVTIHDRVLGALADRGLDAALTAGLDPRRLVDAALDALGSTTKRSPQELGRHLRTIRSHLAGAETLTDPRLVAMRQDTMEIIERNLRRIDHELTDTYENHPDYAELGRVAANARLLEHAAAPAGRTTTGGATLTW